MPLSLKIISSPDGEAISQWNINFPESGGSIGRAYGNTMQLGDASLLLSGTHAIINKSARGYQVMDVSTNGLFINGSHQPLGKKNSASLNDGDVLDLGNYRLMVTCYMPSTAPEKPTGMKSRPSIDERVTSNAMSKNSSLGAWSDDPFASIPSDPGEEGKLPTNIPNTNYMDAPISSIPMEVGISFSNNDNNIDDDPFGEVASESEPTMQSVQLDPFSDDSFDDSPFSVESSFEDLHVSNNNTDAMLAGLDAHLIVDENSSWKEDSDFEDASFITNESFSNASFESDNLNTLTASIASSMLPRDISMMPMPTNDYSMSEKQQELMHQAAEMAFLRILEEMSPLHLEAIFNDFKQPGFFRRKQDYWQMYQRYFKRQQGSQDWQIKFKAYFTESLRMKHLR